MLLLFRVMRADLQCNAMQVHAVELSLSKTEAARRFAAAAHATAEGLEVPMAEASTHELLVEASFMTQQSPPQQQVGTALAYHGAVWVAHICGAVVELHRACITAKSFQMWCHVPSRCCMPPNAVYTNTYD